MMRSARALYSGDVAVDDCENQADHIRDGDPQPPKSAYFGSTQGLS
jgi:hypothetical protein